MRIAYALAAMMMALASAASAAPIQGVIDAQTGFAYARGFTGEVYVGLKLPTAFAVLPPPTGIDPPFPPPFTEFGYAGLEVLNGTYEFGYVVKPNLRQSDFTTFRLRHQANFVSEVVEFAPSFVSHSSAIPTGQAGLFVIIPEPAPLTLIALMMGTLLTAVRLQGRRQDCPAACRGC